MSVFILAETFAITSILTIKKISAVGVWLCVCVKYITNNGIEDLQKSFKVYTQSKDSVISEAASSPQPLCRQAEMLCQRGRAEVS